MSKYNTEAPKTIDTETMRWVLSVLLDTASRRDTSDAAECIEGAIYSIAVDCEEPWQRDILEKLAIEADDLAGKLPSGEDALNAYINTREALQDMIDDLDQFSENQSK